MGNRVIIAGALAMWIGAKIVANLLAAAEATGYLRGARDFGNLPPRA